MGMRFAKNSDDKWSSGKYKIRKADRAYPVQNEGEKQLRPYNKDRTPDVFHCYHDDKYIAQRYTLAEAKSAVEDHKKEAKG